MKGPIGIAFALAAIACATPPKDATQVAAKSALVQAYEARLDLVSDQAETCADAIAAVRDEEARWSPIWSKMNTNPEPPRKLICH